MFAFARRINLHWRVEESAYAKSPVQHAYAKHSVVQHVVVQNERSASSQNILHIDQFGIVVLHALERNYSLAVVEHRHSVVFHHLGIDCHVLVALEFKKFGMRGFDILPCRRNYFKLRVYRCEQVGYQALETIEHGQDADEGGC